MEKIYILQKDLPSIKAGTRYIKNLFCQNNVTRNDYLPDCLGMGHERNALHCTYVENNPEWFIEYILKIYTEDDMRRCWKVAQCGIVTRVTSVDGKLSCNSITPIKTFNDYLKTL